MYFVKTKTHDQNETLLRTNAWSKGGIRGDRKPIPSIKKLFLILGGLAFLMAACGSDIDLTPTDCDAPLVVNDTEDTSDILCNSQCSLREAIYAANMTCRGPNTIEIGPGTYTLTRVGAGDSQGDLNLRQDVEIIGSDMEEVIIQGAEDWTDRIFSIEEDVEVVMRELTIERGNAGDGNGGGIFNAGDLTLENVFLNRNTAGRGGGLFNSGRAHLEEVKVRSNEATIPLADTNYITDDCGGGIHNAGSMQILSSLIEVNYADVGAGICNVVGGNLSIDSSSISGNPFDWVPDFHDRIPHWGGGVANFSNLVISNTGIRDNAAWQGAGIYARMPAPYTTVFDGITVEGNEAVLFNPETGFPHGGYGGGLYLTEGFHTILNSSINGNNASHDGGGIHIFSAALDENDTNVTISDSSIVNNNAGWSVVADDGGSGGGIWVGGHRPNTWLDMTNVTIGNNYSIRSAGGFYSALIGGGYVRMEHVTITENRSYGISGLYQSYGTTSIKNSIIGNNQNDDCYIREVGNLVSEGFNIEGESSCGFNAEGDLQNQNASLYLTRTAGGGTYYYVPGPSSVALDRIDPDNCPDHDQRHEPRPLGEGCDVGSIEAPSLERTSGEVDPDQIATIPPTPEPQPSTVVTDSLCWKGPGSQYEVISSVTKDTIVELLGTGEVAGWWVIDNPRYPGVACWLPEDNVATDPNLDPSTLNVFPVPPLPTPTITAAPAVTVPKAPGQLSAATTTCNASNYIVTLTWADLATNESGYRVYRDNQLIATLGAGATQYVDHPPYSGPHSYRAEAFNSAGGAKSGSESDSGCVF